jgi:hypothetical protein
LPAASGAVSNANATLSPAAIATGIVRVKSGVPGSVATRAGHGDLIRRQVRRAAVRDPTRDARRALRLGLLGIERERTGDQLRVALRQVLAPGVGGHARKSSALLPALERSG